nr:immunoglobulin mu heavy chain [Bos taurus]NDP06741.1 immunoglobulin mu heavy chain [Bos taurus]NDP13438.1 immunoglobulin mu heavy chain [Bos taurus]
MNPLWTLLFVLSAPRGVLSQVQLRESGPSLVKPSQTLSLTCTVSGFSLSSYSVNWVRQAPGKALECLGTISSSGNTGYNPALKSRLSITKDNSKNQVSLSLSSVTGDDTATYYCAKDSANYGWQSDWGCYVFVYSETYYVDTWGQGLLVTVSSEGESHPRVF